MMKKKLLTAMIAGLVTVSLSLPALAGEWKRDEAGWWYQNEDSSYPNNGWTWINGRCYYFTPEGYCLVNTQTPDGHMVDAGGAWVVDGVVQTQAPEQAEPAQAVDGTTVSIANMTFTVPEGFVQDTSEQEGVFLVNQSQLAVIALLSEPIPELNGYESQADAILQDFFDEVVQEQVGTPSGKSVVQLVSGVWYRYDYANASSMGIPGSINIYLRINSANLQMVMFGGDLSGLDTNAIMNNNLR